MVKRMIMMLLVFFYDAETRCAGKYDKCEATFKQVFGFSF